MISNLFKIFFPVILFLLISCEDRIFLEKEPELILNSGAYTLDSEGYSFDHVILEKDSILYTAIPCNEDGIITFFEIENSGTYLMSLILNRDTLFRRSIYLNEIHNDLTEITVLDVSQGDSFIISPLDDKSSVIDGGYGTVGIYNWQDGRNPTLLNYLKDNEISNLKYIIQTHDDADHYGGLNDVVADGSIFYDKYFTNNSIDLPAVKDTIFFSDDVFGIILHSGDIPNAAETEENNRSITLKLIYKDFEMLFTADIEAEVEDYLLQQSYFQNAQSYDILKVPHHGSSSSSTAPFLELVDPKLSVISVGEGNPWDHPTEPVQERLWDNSNTILRTDLNGDIKILTDGISFQTISMK
ncbi:MAG: MBL fold metallo-hydrolase [Candidatus Delongbacteria bacterium]|jgi:competence protein ComEC|nr:MBL fold metallo-hydrolase [Candidatus Delongbacteria bacterium]